MKKIGAALLLAAVIAGAGVAAPASASTSASSLSPSTGKVFQTYSNWPH